MTWPTVALGELVEIFSGFAFKSDKFNASGDGLPLVRIRDVKSGFSETYYSGEFAERFVVSDGDLLVGMDGEFNCAPWTGGPALLNQRVCRVTAIDVRLDQVYLRRFLPIALKVIEDRTSFVTVKHLSSRDIAAIEIPLPPLPEQRRIAAILDQADALRRLRRRSLSSFSELEQALFNDTFGDLVTNSKGWEEGRVLSDVAHVTSGITKGRRINGQGTREVPYLAVSNVQDGHVRLNAVKTIEATDAEIVRYQLHPGDIVLTEGGDPDKLGRGGIWHGEIGECIHQNHVFRVRIKDADVRPLFLSRLIGSQRGKRYFLRSAKQTTGIASINMSQLKSFPILLPPTSIQMKYEEEMEKFGQDKEMLENSRTAIESLFASLQHRAFRGEL